MEAIESDYASPNQKAKRQPVNINEELPHGSPGRFNGMTKTAKSSIMNFCICY
jgi:hypothetical protein